MIKVLKPGLATSVQDLGREGYYHLGIPPSGALDQYALRAANHLVGNPAGAAGLECALVGPELACNNLPGGGLPGSIRPDQADEPSRGQLQIDTRDGDLLPEPLPQPPHPHGHSAHPGSLRHVTTVRGRAPSGVRPRRGAGNCAPSHLRPEIPYRPTGGANGVRPSRTRRRWARSAPARRAASGWRVSADRPTGPSRARRTA